MKVSQSCPTLCNSPWNPPGQNTGVGVCECESRSVVSNSLWPHVLYSPWNSPGQNIGVGRRSPSPRDLPNPETESACNAGDLGSVPGFGRSPGEGKSYPLQYSGLENSMDCIVHGVTKSWTQLSDFHTLYFRSTKMLFWVIKGQFCKDFTHKVAFFIMDFLNQINTKIQLVSLCEPLS